MINAAQSKWSEQWNSFLLLSFWFNQNENARSDLRVSVYEQRGLNEFSEIKQIRSALLMIISWRWHFVWECSLLFALFNLIIHHHKCRPGLFLVITNFIVAIFILREKDAVYVTYSRSYKKCWHYFYLMNCDNIIMLFILI